MKRFVTASIALLLAFGPISASAGESRYPGKEPLLVGKHVRAAGHNFEWMRLCGVGFDYRGYLGKLRTISKADWRLFVGSGSRVRTHDRSIGCGKSAYDDVKRQLRRYMDAVEAAYEPCEFREECPGAGKLYEDPDALSPREAVSNAM